MTTLKKPKKLKIPPLERKPIGFAGTTKDLLARLKAEKLAREKKKEE